MTATQRTHSPVDGRLVDERPLETLADLFNRASRAKLAQREFRSWTIDRRCELVRAFARIALDNRTAWAEELALQMGRPVSQCPFELSGVHERAVALADLAGEALAPIVPPVQDGFRRWIERVPVGVVLVLAPWNYPYLTAVNSVVGALLGGNSVLLKHSDQTPLCADRFAEALSAAGAPPGLFQAVAATHETVGQFISAGAVDRVSFTGSVPGGQQVLRAASQRRVAVGLELGGKDAAYVRSDANLQTAVEGIVDGAFFNSGQSCCSVERVYVAQGVYQEVVERLVAETLKYRLGSPLSEGTTLGPMVRRSAAEFVRGQIAEAVADGAAALVDEARFPRSEQATPYLAPQILTQVNSAMRIMREESFGPVVCVSSVGTDQEAIARINDSDYGLTASIWTADTDLAAELGRSLQVGTVFCNRCDYLDPYLAWGGVKDSGSGCTLSRLGIEAFTRPQSFHLRLSTL